MRDLEEVGQAIGGCLVGILCLAFTVAMWLLPLALGITILQAAGCV